MLIRQNIFPKNIKDALVTTFVFIIIPIIYYFELFIVLPRYYKQWSLYYNFHFLCGTFILFNLSSNLINVIMCDTSIRGRVFNVNVIKKDWHLCSVCETLVPPRSWHCNTCNICILKRDHHCMFTGCCIGHDNHRFFIVFVFYMFLATIYASYYNVSFMWDYITFTSWKAVFKIIFPLACLFMDFTQDQLYVFLILIVLLGGAFTGVLLVFHVDLMLKGFITFERNQKRSKYDQGKLNNIKIVLGDKWYLVWFAPWVKSELPCDGVSWEQIVSEKIQ